MNNFREPKKIGIIGGAGPMAGAMLFQKVVRICQEKYECKEDADFPSIMLLSYPFANMLKHPFSQECQDLIQAQLKECILKLKSNGIKTIAIACNTLHSFLEKENSDCIELVHMIKETGAIIEEKKLSKVFVLCTSTSVRDGIHAQCFECEYCDSSFQSEIDLLINKILAGKHSQYDAEWLVQRLNAIGARYPADKRIGLVLGCTEFSVFNEQYSLQLSGLCDKFEIVDPTQIVAEALCKSVFNKLEK